VFVCRLNDLLKVYDQLEDVIPACLLPVFKPYLKRAEKVLLPGVTTHGWTALVIDECTYASSALPLSVYTRIFLENRNWGVKIIGKRLSFISFFSFYFFSFFISFFYFPYFALFFIFLF